jgi:putative transposase
MLDLSSFSQALRSLELPTKVSILFEVLQSFLCLSHSSGVRPLSRYCGFGGSERSLFRMIRIEIPWLTINLSLFKYFVLDKKAQGADLYALVGDEVVEAKAGKSTYGMRKFYSSTAKRSLSGVDFFGFTLVNLRTGKTAPVDLQQVVYTQADEDRLATEKAVKKDKKDKKDKEQALPKLGRPKGSPNKTKEDPATTKPVYRAFKEAIQAIFAQMLALNLTIPLVYMLLDGAYASAHYIELLQKYKLAIISKLPSNAALYFPYEGEKSKTKPKKYGDKVVFTALDAKYHVQTIREDHIKYDLFSYQAFHKCSPAALINVLTIRATHTNGSITHAHIFTNELTLSALEIKQYYEYRFQIEFDFRDAKQLFGLSKIKNYHKTQVNNMFRMSFSALSFAKILQTQWAIKLNLPNLSLIDLKTIYKAQFYLKNAINNTPNLTEYFFSTQFINNFVPTDIINRK